MIDCAKILEIANREMEGTDLFTVSCKCSPMNEVELLSIATHRSLLNAAQNLAVRLKQSSIATKRIFR